MRPRERRIRFAQPRRPLPGAPKMSGKLIAHEHLWDQSPFSVRQGSGGCTKSRSRRARGQFTLVRAARMRKTLLLLGLYCVLGSGARRATVPVASYTECGSDQRSEPPLRCAWASFYRSKGSPTGANVVEGKSVKLVGVVTVDVQCSVPNLDGGGQGH